MGFAIAIHALPAQFFSGFESDVSTATVRRRWRPVMNLVAVGDVRTQVSSRASNFAANKSDEEQCVYVVGGSSPEDVIRLSAITVCRCHIKMSPP